MRGEHERVAGELDHGVGARVVRRMDFGETVDRREATVGRGLQRFGQSMHGVRHYVRAMRVDVMSVPKPLREMGAVAQSAVDAGFTGMLLTEGGRTAFSAATAAALAAPGLELSTGVAVAFPRSPMITAQLAWELQELTGGSFRLGLGTQVRTHVVRRYGVEFEHPGPRLRDYVRAVKACFAGFRGEPLDHHGEFYELTFLNRQWSPGPIDEPDPKVDIAAVNPWMLQMAGEVADGVHVHPLGEPGYLARHVLPGLAEGAARAGRDAGELTVIVPALTIVGDTDEEVATARERARMSLSFYGSTPNYAFIWDEAGFEGTTARVRERQKAGDFAGMAAEITDEHVSRVRHRGDVGHVGRRARRQVRRHRRSAGALQRGRRDARTFRALRRGRPQHRRPPPRLIGMQSIRRAVADDLDALIALHEQFCTVDGHPFDRSRATAAFVPLLVGRSPRRRLDHRRGERLRRGHLGLVDRSRRRGGCPRRDLRHRPRWRHRHRADRAPAGRRPGPRSGSRLSRDRIGQRTLSAAFYGRHGFVVDDSVWMSHPFVDLD